MSTRFLLLGLILVLATAAAAQPGPNEIGIFTVRNPDPADPDPALARSDCPFGEMFTLYVVLMNPWNFDLDEPFLYLSGYQFRIDHPGWFINGYFEGTGTVNLASFPNLDVRTYMGLNPPIARVLVTMIVGDMTMPPEPRYAYIRPITNEAAQLIPGQLAVLDHLDGGSPQRAVPVSGGFDAPVFGCLADVVHESGTTWGELKALYR